MRICIFFTDAVSLTVHIKEKFAVPLVGTVGGGGDSGFALLGCDDRARGVYRFAEDGRAVAECAAGAGSDRLFGDAEDGVIEGVAGISF